MSILIRRRVTQLDNASKLWGFDYGSNNYFSYNVASGEYTSGTVSGLASGSRVRYGAAVVGSKIFFACAISNSYCVEVVDISSGVPVIVAQVTKSSAGVSSSWESAGIVAHPNGFVYSFPYTPSDSYILKINPNTYAVTRIAVSSWVDGADGCCVGYNGNIYITPNYGDGINMLNPSTNAVTKPFTFTNTSSLYGGIIQAENGHLYAMPLAATNGLLDINLTSNTFVKTNISATGYFNLLNPVNSDELLSFNYNSNYSRYSISTASVVTGTIGYVIRAVQPVGDKIYMLTSGGLLVKYDPANHTFTSIRSVSFGAANKCSLVLAPAVVPVPANAADIIGTEEGRLWNKLYNRG